MSCGIDTTLLRLYLNELLEEAIKTGKVQGGLRDCTNEMLLANTQMLSCAEITGLKAELQQEFNEAINAVVERIIALREKLADDVSELKLGLADVEARLNALIAKEVAELLKLIKELQARTNDDTKVINFENLNGTLRLTNSDNTKFDVELPTDTTIVSGTITDKTLTLTDNKGGTVEIDLCKWRGAQPCEYYATMQIALTKDECGIFRRVAWAFHPDDLRDPAADVRLVDCNGNTIGWLYSTSEGNHTIDIQDESGTLIGYAMSSPIAKVWGDGCC